MVSNLDSKKTTIRQNHNVRGFLSVLRGKQLLTATIVDKGTEPYQTITISLTSGSVTGIYDATVYVYSSTGYFKGITRVAHTTVPSPTSISIQETVANNLPLANGDLIEIYEERRIWPIFPASDETFAPDGVAYTDQNANLPPITNSGGAKVVFVDDGDTTATIDFTDNGSVVIDEDSTGAITHLWEFGSDCTPETSTSANPTGIIIPVSTRYVKHTVVDSSNSKPTTQYVPVAIHNASNPPLEVDATRLSGNISRGYQLSFNFREYIDQSDLPDGVPIAFSVIEFPESLGALTAQEPQVKFFGFVKEDSQQISFDNRLTSFTAISPITRLYDIIGFSQVFTSVANPQNWQEIEDLTVKRAIIQIIRYYTTCFLICDFIFTSTDYDYPEFYVQQQIPFQQIQELADSIDSLFISDRRGAILIKSRFEYIELTPRASVTNLYTIDEYDIVSIDIRRKPYFKTSTVEIRGLTSDGEPFFSRYPATNVPNIGTISTIQDRLITSDQNDLNQRAGKRGAFLDKIYNDGTFLIHVPEISVRFIGHYDFFDFYDYIVKFSMSNWQTRDDRIWWLRYIINNIEITYEPEQVEVVLTLQGETYTLQGETYIPPVTDTGTSGDDFPDPPTTPTGPSYEDFYGVNTIAAFQENGKYLVTTNFRDVSPIWTLKDISASLTGNIIAVAVDPKSPLYAGTGSTVNMFLVDEAGIKLVSDVFGSFSVSTKYTFAQPVANLHGNIDIDYTNSVGLYIQACYKRDDGTGDIYAVSSEDGGSTWNTEQFLHTVAIGEQPGISIDPLNAGVCYITDAWRGIWKSTDYGNSFSEIYHDGSGLTRLSGNFINIADSSKFFVKHEKSAANYIARFDTIGETLEYSSEGETNANRGPDTTKDISRWLFGTDTSNKEVLYWIAPSGSDLTIGIYKSTNAFTGDPMNYTQVVDLSTLSAFNNGWYHLAVVDSNNIYIWGSNGRIGWYSATLGQYYDRLGDDPNKTSTLNNAFIVGICGGG